MIVIEIMLYDFTLCVKNAMIAAEFQYISRMTNIKILLNIK